VACQNDLAYLSESGPHCCNLQQYVHTVPILGKHTLEAGDLPGDSFQAPVGIAARLLVHSRQRMHEACRCETNLVTPSLYRSQSNFENPRLDFVTLGSPSARARKR
jgi:hypothetical protein